MNYSILDYYPIALAEGEGAGTAYEYFVKARLISRLIGKNFSNARILVAGLPERYGFSLDFAVWANSVNASILYIDDRQPRLERFDHILNKLVQDSILSGGRISSRYQADLCKIKSLADADLFFSCEVLQRLDEANRKNYVRQFLAADLPGVIFAPNAGNGQHAALSGLKSVSLEELRQWSAGFESRKHTLAFGLIDMPPFPPGVKRSDTARQQAGQSLIERTLFMGIQWWSYGECLLPQFAKRPCAHIAYMGVAAK